MLTYKHCPTCQCNLETTPFPYTIPENNAGDNVIINYTVVQNAANCGANQPIIQVRYVQ